MMNNKATKRSYNSTRRQESALQTRKTIARAAMQLFEQRGYRGASIDAIAAAAEVAPETIYATFGSKREVLHYLLDTALGGDEQPVKLIDRPEPQAVLAETDPHRLLAGFTEGISHIIERAAPVFVILAEAAKTEPTLADLLARMRDDRIANMRRVAGAIARLAPLRMDEAQAAETIWALASPELFTALKEQRGWSREQFAAWLRDSLTRLLLE